jgi:hypothetical protein
MMATTEILLQTRRFFFRSWCEQDLELALGLWGDPRVTGFDLFLRCCSVYD